jgi:hypothetical protein
MMPSGQASTEHWQWIKMNNRPAAGECTHIYIYICFILVLIADNRKALLSVAIEHNKLDCSLAIIVMYPFVKSWLKYQTSALNHF